MTDSQIEKLAWALTQISHGGDTEPLGIEALVMALQGKGSPGDGKTIGGGLYAIADAIDGLTSEINALRRSTPTKEP